MDENGPRVAVVGCGRWGRNHVRSLAELGALAGIVDHDPARAAAEGEKHGVPALTFEAALDDAAIAGLVFALPPSQNLPFGTRALEAGKHLLVEKPLALSVQEGERLCRVAEERGRVLMVGHILQYHPAFVRLAGLVREGQLGRLLSLVSTRLDLGRIRREEDALWALAPHDVSMLLALAGSGPTTVSASGGTHTHPAIADNATVDLRFPEGLRGEIRVSWLHPYKEQRLVAIGSDAMAVFDDREPWERKLVLHRYGLRQEGRHVAISREDEEAIPLTPAEPLKEELRAFLRSVATGKPPVTDGREGLRVLDVLERASAALARGR